jgi:Zn-dependent membrane protease YugP
MTVILARIPSFAAERDSSEVHHMVQQAIQGEILFIESQVSTCTHFAVQISQIILLIHIRSRRRDILLVGIA